MVYLDYDQVDERTKELLEAFNAKSYKKYWAKKRIFDIVFSGMLLLVSLPFLLVIALIILFVVGFIAWFLSCLIT